MASLQQYTLAIPQMAVQGADPTDIINKIAKVIKSRQRGQALEDAISDIFEPEELPPAGAPSMVEQPSPAPAAPAGGAPTGGPGGALQSLLSSLSASGQGSASARTVVRR